MIMTTKLWISDKLELRYSPTGWPEKPGRYFTHYTVNGQTAETGQRAAEIYTEALAKTKAESIPVDGGDIPGSLTHALMTADPDSFIEYAGEVEFKYEVMFPGHGWESCSESDYFKFKNDFTQARQIARLKPVNSAITEVMKNIPPGKLDQHYKGEPRENAQTTDLNDSKLTDVNDKDVASMAFSPGVITEGYRFSIVFSAGNLRVSVPHGSQYHIKNISIEPIDILDSNGEPASLSPGDTKVFGEGLKARILEAFEKKYRNTDTMNSTRTLSKVLDELNIK